MTVMMENALTLHEFLAVRKNVSAQFVPSVEISADWR
ncbi:Uncharacterised protein [Salmonella enterica subsp. arizonae]|nr:Uncharacterised protein [Salmonella enterica subsp. arizonae]